MAMSTPSATMKAGMVVSSIETPAGDSSGTGDALGGGLPRARVERQQVRQRLRVGRQHGLQSCSVYIVDLVEADAAVQEGGDRLLVGRVQHRGRARRRAQRVPGQLQAGKAVAVAAAVQRLERHV